MRPDLPKEASSDTRWVLVTLECRNKGAHEKNVSIEILISETIWNVYTEMLVVLCLRWWSSLFAEAEVGLVTKVRQPPLQWEGGGNFIPVILWRPWIYKLANRCWDISHGTEVSGRQPEANTSVGDGVFDSTYSEVVVLFWAGRLGGVTAGKGRDPPCNLTWVTWSTAAVTSTWDSLTQRDTDTTS